MILRDLYSNIAAGYAKAVTALSNDTAIISSWVDLQGSDALVFLIQSTTLSDTDATFAVTVQHADADDYSDVATVGAEMLQGISAANFGAADDDVVKLVGYVGDRRYARVVITPTGNTGTGSFAVLAIRRPLIRGTVY